MNEPDVIPPDAVRFLRSLDPRPHAKFTFQTFDEAKLGRAHLVHILHGTLEEHGAALGVLNDAILPKGAAEVLALWCIFTHALDAFAVAPLLAIISPTKQRGKARTVGICAKLVARPLTASNISPAAVYRTIEKCHPTLLIDEADSFLKGNFEAS